MPSGGERGRHRGPQLVGEVRRHRKHAFAKIDQGHAAVDRQLQQLQQVLLLALQLKNNITGYI